MRKQRPKKHMFIKHLNSLKIIQRYIFLNDHLNSKDKQHFENLYDAQKYRIETTQHYNVSMHIFKTNFGLIGCKMIDINRGSDKKILDFKYPLLFVNIKSYNYKGYVEGITDIKLKTKLNKIARTVSRCALYADLDETFIDIEIKDEMNYMKIQDKYFEVIKSKVSNFLDIYKI